MTLLLTVPLICYIEIRFVRDGDRSILAEDPRQLSSALTRLAALPPACAFVNYLIAHIRTTTFWWERNSQQISCWTCCCPFDPHAFWPMLLVSLGLLRNIVTMLLVKRLADQAAWYMTLMISMILLGAYYKFLDKVDDLIQAMREEQDMINKTKTVSKMQSLVRNITRSGRDEKDAVYCFEETNTVPAQVLSYVWWPYYFLGKILGAATVMSMFMGVDPQVITHILYSGILLSAATLGGVMFELGPSALSLLRLSLHKPFYVGDLVTLNANGAMDAPTSIMGFVENITMMYVVVRNFEMKQTWIAHRQFSNMIIQNWTRRPSKTVKLEIGISCRCPLKKVEQLRTFAQKWIEKSEEIQQENYRKFHITKTGNGYNIEIIFFPGIGVSHRGIRQKFLVAFMAFAEELQVPFVPLNIMNNFCDESAIAPIDGGWVLEDSAFEKYMPDPLEKLPKGVGLGFRQFPAARDENAVEVELRAEEVKKCADVTGIPVEFSQL